MILFTCTCDWKFVVGKKQVFGPMFRGPGEHQAYWHIGRMMTRSEWEDEYGDCALRLERLEGSADSGVR